MTFEGACRALDGRRETCIRLGLSRVRRVLKRLGNPHRGLSCIHVAGTNGKGSVCAILESVLRAAGRRTGLYLSPHLRSVRERIQVRGRPISPRDFSRLFKVVWDADQHRELTYFELLTCLAFLHFRESRTEIVVLETGLGGRLDATNVVERPLASVITSLDYDHQEFLGSTLSRIAGEKAGIIKQGSPIFCPRLPAEAFRQVSLQAARCQAPLSVLRRPWKTVRVDWSHNRQVLSDGRRRYVLSLLGSRQDKNVALARMVLDRVFPVDESAWREGLSRVHLPARFEVIPINGKTAIVDGGHNPEAVRALRRTLLVSPWRGRPLRWIMGLMRDKDRRAVVSALARGLDDVVATQPPSSRALAASRLAQEIRRQAPAAAVRETADARQAVRDWLGDPGAPKTAVICGSFYLAALCAPVCGGRDG